ncbi:MAG: hypothetical protein ACRERU_11570 [Methylococcales bacterium]
MYEIDPLDLFLPDQPLDIKEIEFLQLCQRNGFFSTIRVIGTPPFLLIGGDIEKKELEAWIRTSALTIDNE